MSRRFFGIVFILIGFFLFLSSTPVITGFTVLESYSVKLSVQIIGIVFFIGGIILLTSEKKTLDSHVEVYDDGIGKNVKDREQQHYFMNDPDRDINDSGRVSLSEFSRQIATYRKEKNGEEYIKVIRDSYGSDLHNIVSQGGERAKIARAFLDVLEGPEERQQYCLNKEENRAFTESFRTYDGTLTKKQKDLLKRNGVSWEHSGTKHIHLMKGNHVYPIPATPSDRRGGLNMAKGIIKFIEKNHSD